VAVTFAEFFLQSALMYLPVIYSIFISKSGWCVADLQNAFITRESINGDHMYWR
jgi:hypothetical protein